MHQNHFSSIKLSYQIIKKIRIILILMIKKILKYQYFIYRISANSFLPWIVSHFNSFRGNYSIYEVKIAIMQKLYENFHIFYFQKRIVSAETIRGNTVVSALSFLLCIKTWIVSSLKVSWFQNVLLVSAFGPKCQQKIWQISALESEKW